MAERKINTAESRPGGVQITPFRKEKLHGNVVTGDNTTGPSSRVEPATDYHQGVLEVEKVCQEDMENNRKKKKIFLGIDFFIFLFIAFSDRY